VIGKEDKLVKSAITQILASFIAFGVLAGRPVLAQYNNYPSQVRGRTASPRSFQVAQQPSYQEAPADFPPDSMKNAPSSKGAAASEPGELFPDLIAPNQSPEAGCMGVENGLWDGCGPGDGCTVCGGGYCTPPLWYTEQAARVLTRTAPRLLTLGSIELPINSTNSQGEPVFSGLAFISVDNTRLATYDVAAGYKGTVGHYLGRDAQNRDDFLEFTYWGMNTWIGSFITTSGPEQISLLGGTFTAGRIVSPLVTSQWSTFSATQTTPDHPFGAGGFDFVEEQKYSVSTEIHNFELNLRLCPRGRPDQLVLHPNGRWRRECQPGMLMSYLVGIRYMTIGDGFLLHSQGTVDVNDQSFATSADQNVQTQNDLLGLQFGAAFNFQHCNWDWNAHVKVGPYLNFADNDQIIVNHVPDGYPLSDVLFNDHFFVRRQKAAFVGEVGFSADYKFRPNLIGRAGYDFMWVTGLALAPEQVEFSYAPVGKINCNGSILAHGIELGLEWRW
jgi:hypothetical protein